MHGTRRGSIGIGRIVQIGVRKHDLRHIAHRKVDLVVLHRVDHHGLRIDLTFRTQELPGDLCHLFLAVHHLIDLRLAEIGNLENVGCHAALALIDGDEGRARLSRNGPLARDGQQGAASLRAVVEAGIDEEPVAVDQRGAPLSLGILDRNRQVGQELGVEDRERRRSAQITHRKVVRRERNAALGILGNLNTLRLASAAHHDVGGAHIVGEVAVHDHIHRLAARNHLVLEPRILRRSINMPVVADPVERQIDLDRFLGRSEIQRHIVEHHLLVRLLFFTREADQREAQYDQRPIQILFHSSRF